MSLTATTFDLKRNSSADDIIKSEYLGNYKLWEKCPINMN